MERRCWNNGNQEIRLEYDSEGGCRGDNDDSGGAGR
jgi:hypothetical protein